MQVVVYGMAIALFLAFLVALLHPGDRPAPESEGEQEAAGSDTTRRPEPV